MSPEAKERVLRMVTALQRSARLPKPPALAVEADYALNVLESVVREEVERRVGEAYGG